MLSVWDCDHSVFIDQTSAAGKWALKDFLCHLHGKLSKRESIKRVNVQQVYIPLILCIHLFIYSKHAAHRAPFRGCRTESQSELQPQNSTWGHRSESEPSLFSISYMVLKYYIEHLALACILQWWDEEYPTESQLALNTSKATSKDSPNDWPRFKRIHT